MKGISPCLWYDDEAEIAANRYVEVFEEGSIDHVRYYGSVGEDVHGRPPGSVMTVDFTLNGRRVIALNGGPQITFTPATSLFVTCESPTAVDDLYEGLEGGDVLMPLDAYPFSDRYVWFEDEWGVSWQLHADPAGERSLDPCLMFVGEHAGNAEAAVDLYTSVFPDSAIAEISRYGSGADPNPEGAVQHAQFHLGGDGFRAMDSYLPHDFSFTEGISLQVDCETQTEIDRYWDALSADPSAEQCGWLMDRFGVSWQIVPALLAELTAADDAQIDRVMDAILSMKKLDIETIRAAAAGEGVST